MMKNLVKLFGLLLTLGSVLVISSNAHAFPGTRGPFTPSYISAPGVTPDNDNTVGGHLMRMQNGSMNPNGMLMQHHFQHSGTDGTNPDPIYTGPETLSNTGTNGLGNPGIHVVSGNGPGASQLVINVANFMDNISLKQMRVEILAFDSATDEIATVNSVGATKDGAAIPAGDINQVGFHSQANLAHGGVTWDYSYTDFVISPNPDWETITIDANGANIAQVFVWTVSAVPVPAAVWLFGTGLLGMIGISRRRGGAEAVA